MSAVPALELRAADADALGLFAAYPDLALWAHFPPPDGLVAYAAYAVGVPGAIAAILLRPILDEVELLAIAVAPEWRGRGVGQECWRRLWPALCQQGVLACHAEVAADNQAAQNFYQRLGFRLVGQIKGYYQRGNGAVDAMRLTLSCNAVRA